MPSFLAAAKICSQDCEDWAIAAAGASEPTTIAMSKFLAPRNIDVQ
jgi:hypothetical protein